MSYTHGKQNRPISHTSLAFSTSTLWMFAMVNLWVVPIQRENHNTAGGEILPMAGFQYNDPLIEQPIWPISHTSLALSLPTLWMAAMTKLKNVSVATAIEEVRNTFPENNIEKEITWLTGEYMRLK